MASWPYPLEASSSPPNSAVTTKMSPNIARCTLVGVKSLLPLRTSVIIKYEYGLIQIMAFKLLHRMYMVNPI